MKQPEVIPPNKRNKVRYGPCAANFEEVEQCAVIKGVKDRKVRGNMCVKEDEEAMNAVADIVPYVLARIQSKS